MKLEDIGLPSFGPSLRIDPKKYIVKYLKVCVDDLTALCELELLETRGLEGKDTVILSRNTFDFMGKYYVVVNYMEKLPDDPEKKEKEDK